MLKKGRPTRPQRVPQDNPSELVRVRCPQDGSDEFPAARVQRGLRRPRVARAQGTHRAIPPAGGLFLSILLEDFSILLRVHSRLVGKAEGGTVGIAGVVEIDSIMPTDSFHRRLKGNSLGVEVTRCMCAAG
jgi:hypothetical protein